MEGRRLDDFLEALQRFRRRSRLSDAFQSASRNSTGKLYRVEFLGDFILSGTFSFFWKASRAGALSRRPLWPYSSARCLPQKNSYFEQAGVPHFRLLHLPLLWDRQQLLQQFEHEGLIPLDFRPQLSRRSQL